MAFRHTRVQMSGVLRIGGLLAVLFRPLYVDYVHMSMSMRCPCVLLRTGGISACVVTELHRDMLV